MKRTKTTDTDTDAVVGLAKKVEHARGRLGVLDQDAVKALIDAPSDAELAAARENAEHSRLRQLRAQRDELDSQLAAHDSLREAQVRMLELDIRDAVDARKALAEERRTNAAAAKLARLHRYSTRTPMVCGVVIGIGMIWSAINVQQNMAPGGVSDPMFWASFLIEGMVSGLLIMVALGSNVVQETAGIDPGPKERWAEGGLLGFTLALNTYPYVRDSQWYDATLHAVAPVMIGVALLVMHGLGERYAQARRRITEEAIDLDVHLPDLPTLATVQPVPPTVSPTVQPSGESVVGDHVATETVQPWDQAAAEPRTQTVHTVHRSELDLADPVHSRAEDVHPEGVDGQGERSSLLHAESTEQEVHRHRAPELSTVQTFAEDITVEAEAVGGDLTGVADQHSIDADRVDENIAVSREALMDAREADEAHQRATQVSPQTVHSDAQDTGHSELSDERVPLHGAPSAPETAHQNLHGADDTVATVHSAAEATAHGADETANTGHEMHGAAEFVELAEAIYARLGRTKFSVGDIARSLWLHRVHGHGADRIYRDGGPHRSQNLKWIGIADEIDAERAMAAEVESALAPVITLRK